MSPTEREKLLAATRAAWVAARRLTRAMDAAAIELAAGPHSPRQDATIFNLADDEEAALTHAMSVLWELRRSSKANAT